MGTPHCGSSMADWAATATTLLKLFKQCNDKVLKALIPGSKILWHTQDYFCRLLEKRKVNNPMSIANFFEELPLKALGKVRETVAAGKVDYP
jgi:hypothetical protein